MALDIPVSDVFDMIGHTGREIVFADLPEPICRRGHHVQEVIDVALRRGFSVTPIELYPVLAPAPKPGGISLPDHRLEVVRFADNWQRFTIAIALGKGVITGQGRNCPHAVAFDHGNIFDPDGKLYRYCRETCEREGFYTQCVWQINPLTEQAP
jgi:hypothetical protein